MIKIVTGTTYGARINGKLEAKTKNSEPFSVDEKEEKRLVELGVAEYVDTKGNSAKPNNKPLQQPEGKTENKKGKQTEGKTENKKGKQTEKPKQEAPKFDAKETVVE